ncbi:unnamed protein product [Lota lota]
MQALTTLHMSAYVLPATRPDSDILSGHPLSSREEYLLYPTCNCVGVCMCVCVYVCEYVCVCVCMCPLCNLWYLVFAENMCVSGDGSNYRGTVSISRLGHSCINWDSYSSWEHDQTSKGLGPHNHCRNPNQSLMPWCRVRRGKRVVREFCDIRKCEPETELTCGERTEHPRNKIVGGVVAPIQSHPWVSAIYRQRSGFLCGGSLIAPCWVLTAAHCFPDGNNTLLRQLSVYLGKSALNETDVEKEQKFTVEQLVLHAGYNFTVENYDNDIALLKIRSSVGACAARTTWTRTVCLPPPLTTLPPGMQCTIAGYGQERERAWHYSQYLREAKVNLLSQSLCRSRSYNDSAVTDNMFCAASPDWSRDSCQGDSGGPLVCEAEGRVFLFGVVSWGDGCARRNKPGVYTRLTNYNSWIAQKTGLLPFTTGAMYPKK